MSKFFYIDENELYFNNMMLDGIVSQRFTRIVSQVICKLLLRISHLFFVLQFQLK